MTTPKRVTYLLSKIEKAFETIAIGNFEHLYDDDKEEIIINFKDRFGNYHHANLYIMDSQHYLYYHNNNNTQTIKIKDFEEGLEMLARIIILAMQDNQQIRKIFKLRKIVIDEQPIIENIIFQFF